MSLTQLEMSQVPYLILKNIKTFLRVIFYIISHVANVIRFPQRSIAHYIDLDTYVGR